jgi:hypothetical protein
MKREDIEKIVPPFMRMGEEDVRQWDLIHTSTPPESAWVRYEEGYNVCRAEVIKKLRRVRGNPSLK